MAKTIWPDGEPLGQCLIVGEEAGTCTRVVGVAEDTHRDGLRERPFMHYYLPAGQEVGFGGSALVVRPLDPGRAPIPEIRRVLSADDPSATHVRVQTVQERVDPQIRPWRQAVVIFVASGVLALIVAGLGVYSIISYLVADRRREIGVRLALGARPADISALVLRSSLTTAAIGLALGAVVAMVAATFVEPVLFDTSSRDPLVYAGTACLLLMVAAGAALAPARRARAVSPIEVLRAE
jgi:predicted lysophospholipase L1 biosynthesis ABC-type transport system permease subunit